jgi:hypothetical protein
MVLVVDSRRARVVGVWAGSSPSASGRLPPVRRGDDHWSVLVVTVHVSISLNFGGAVMDELVTDTVKQYAIV